MKLQVNGKRSKFSSLPGPGILLIFEIFQSVPPVRKSSGAEVRVPPLAKTSVTTSFQSSDGWMFEKTVKWSVGEGRRHQ